MSTQMLAIVKDGKIQTLDSIDLPEGTELVVTLDLDIEAVDWSSMNLNGLSRAYTDDEPEYEISQLKKLNPTVVLSPVKQKYQLDELLVGVTPELIGGEYDWGEPVGGEAW